MSKLNKTLLVSILALASFAVASPLVAQERTWTSGGGEFQTVAAFVKLEDDTVFLRTAKGVIPVPIDKLSAEDQQYVREITTRPTLDDAILTIEVAEMVPGGKPASLNEQSNIDPAKLEELQGDFQESGIALFRRENVFVVSQTFHAISQKETVPPLIIELIKELANSSNKQLRLQSLKLLARFDSNASFPRIIAGINDKSFDVRWTALELATYLQDVRAIDPLIERFKSEDSAKVVSTLISFGSLVEERVFPFLESDKQVHVANTIKILTIVGTEKSIAKITPLLDSESTTLKLTAQASLRSLKKRLAQQPQ